MTPAQIKISIVCIIVASLMLFSCSGKPKNNNHSQKKQPVIDNTIHDFQWYKKTGDYYQKRIAIYGFIFIDSIQNEIGPNRFTVYERPNCYKCGETVVQTDVKMPIIAIDDTSFTNEQTGPQWRLVKIIARVENYQYSTIERFEMAEYSYPDYIESGYQKLTNELTTKNNYYDEPAYIEGKLELKSINANTGYVYLGITQTRLSKKVSIYIKSGNGPNTANPLPNEYSMKDLKVRDKMGVEVQNKRLRLFGRYETELDPELSNDYSGMLHVEMIEAIQ